MEILKVLWTLGEGSVRDVHERLSEQSGLHFNTIQTQLRIMDRKRLVAHRQVGKTFIYRPLRTREQVSKHFLQKVFNGALDQLVLSMLSARKVNENELRELENLISDARRKKASRKSSKER